MKHCTLPTLLAVKTTIFTYRAEQLCWPKTAKTLRLVKCVLRTPMSKIRLNQNYAPGKNANRICKNVVHLAGSSAKTHWLCPIFFFYASKRQNYFTPHSNTLARRKRFEKRVVQAQVV